MYNWIKNQQGRITWQTLIVMLVVLILGTSVSWIFINKKDSNNIRLEKNVLQVAQPNNYQKPLVIAVLDQVLNITPVYAAVAKLEKINDNTIKYINAYANTDVEQIKYPNKLKESLILKNAGHPEKFEYQIDTENFNWEFDVEGNIIISSKKEIIGEVPSSDGSEISAQRMRQYSQERSKFFKIPKPFLEEMARTNAEGNPAFGEASAELRGKEEDYGDVKTEIVGDRLILTPDQTWLKSHQYPIILDPTVEKMPQMVKEIAEKRSYNSLTFLNDDGSYTTMAHVGQINYQDENGKFQPVDTTLQATGTGWEQDKASYKAIFPKYADEWLEFENMYEQGGTLFKMKPVADHVTGELVTNESDIWHDKKVVYKNAFGSGNDLELIAGNIALFKYVKIGQKPANLDNDLEIPFELGLKEGEKLIINGEEWNGIDEVVALEQIGIEIVGGSTSYLKEFMVWDNKGKSEPIKIRIANQNGKIYFIKILPKEFLVAAEYPVYTDAVSSYYSGVGDGGIVRDDSAWDTVHNNTAGETVYVSVANGWSPEIYYDSTPTYSIGRAFLPINTADLDDNAVITAATLYTWAIETRDDEEDGYGYVNIVQTTQVSNTTLITGDFDTCGATHSPTTGSTNKDADTISIVAYTQWTLNATGLTWISKTSYTKLGMRMGHDLADIAPNVDGSNNKSRVYFSEQTGTANDPYISITYTLAPTTSSVTDTPDPTNPGRSVSFIVDWYDIQDSVKIKICKTNSLTSQVCDGGSWASSTDFTTNDPAVAIYDVVAADAGQTRDYWAFVCDTNAECTTGTSGTFSVNVQSVVPDIKIRGGEIRGGTKMR